MRCTIYGEKSTSTGRTSLILQTYYGSVRKKRSLGLYFKTNPQTEADRRDKKEKLMLATKIAHEEELKLLNGEYAVQEKYKTTEDFVVYAEHFIEQHAVKDKKKFNGVVKKLQVFMGMQVIPCYEITEVVLQRFVKDLESKMRGESPHSYFAKLKLMLRAATSELYFRANPAANIKVKQKSFIQKDVLTTEEIQKLYSTPLKNDEVRRSFLFACLSGLRWCDLKLLTWKDIQKNTLRIVQAKTGFVVSIPLNEDALALLGERAAPDALVFKLPSHTGASNWLTTWAEKAGIYKHLSYHVGRHSYGTALIANGVDVSIASKLLGHTSLKHTQRYVRISEDLKTQAVQKLPSILTTKTNTK